MLCDKCNKNIANFHKSVTINGKHFETHLCSECAAHMESDPFVDILGDMLDERLEWNEADKEFVSAFDVMDELANCILPFEQVTRKEQVKDYKLDEGECLGDELQTLQNQLKLAVEVENYEEAAKLKKQIDKLKESNKEDK